MNRARSDGPGALALSFAVMALAGLVAGCSRHAHSAAPPPVPVRVATAIVRDVPYEIAADGTVEPVQTAAVEPQVTGIVDRVAFAEGAAVTRGQLLFEVDPRPYRDALDQATANLWRDQASLLAARRDASRYVQLVAEEAVDQADADAKVAAADALVGNVRADSAALKIARLNLEQTHVRAPIAGLTSALLVHQGDLVRGNEADPMVVINQLAPIRVRFSVPERDLPLLHRGAEVPVYVDASEADSTWEEGRLTFEDNKVDTTTGSVLLKAVFPNRGLALLPGEFTRVRVVPYVERQAVVVPAEAVNHGQSGAFVFVVHDGRAVEMRPVTVDRTTADVAVVARGLKPGDRVVTDGLLQLSSGARVVVTSAS